MAHISRVSRAQIQSCVVSSIILFLILVSCNLSLLYTSDCFVFSSFRVWDNKIASQSVMFAGEEGTEWNRLDTVQP